MEVNLRLMRNKDGVVEWVVVNVVLHRHLGDSGQQMKQKTS